MRRALISCLALALAGAAAAQTARPPGDAPASTLERWSWNARERTAAGSRALAGGAAAPAVEAFDTARRLLPEDPRTGFNSGTARLGSDDAAAAGLLARAAASASPELAPAAWYNLGNARLAMRDAAGAVEAYRETLRRRPDDAAAKFNLELALRELERQRERQRQQQAAQRGQSPDDAAPQPQPGGGADDAAPPPPDGEPGQPPTGEPRPEPAGEGEPRDGGAPPRAERPPSPLPQFHDLPDMTAEQAAAILRAVENLELAERRERAAREAALRATGDRDW